MIRAKPIRAGGKKPKPMDDQPATKQDLMNLERDLKQFILEREVSTIRWFIGTFIGAQIAYFAITLTAVWFMLSHLPK
jgi:hypothetical protein